MTAPHGFGREEVTPYPGDDGDGASLRMMTMPVQPPQRPRKARKRSPVPDCEACGTEPCERHGYDVLASVGAAPAGDKTPDEYVHDWRPV